MSNPSGTYQSNKNNPSYIYVILSVSLVLFLLGFFGLFLLHAPKWIKVYKEQVNVMIEIKGGTSKEQILALTNSLEQEPYIKSESVRFVSKEEVAEDMKEELGAAENTLDVLNPFYDMIHFNMNASSMQNDSMQIIREKIKENDFVSDVFYQELLVDQINNNLRKIGFVALFLGFFFIIVAVVLIHNTIRLAMYSNRFVIKNMQLVGASWSFITKPYLTKGFFNGLWSGIISIILLLVLVLVINYQFPELRLDIWLEDIVGLILVMISLIILGILICFTSTYFVVNRYLRMRLDDLY
ncbi:MAG: cell division transport system permease protein [Granulosicoccus sp.]|jgi:cell division transport system permease protein